MRPDPLPECPINRKVVGAGLLTLDVVVPESPDAALRVHAGGTCGNVLTALAYLDWTAYPVSRLGDDGPAIRIRRDLASWKVCLDFVLQDAADSTPVIAHHIRGTAGGGVTHSFSWRCPACGADLPRYKPLRITDVEDLFPRLPAAGAFFFDRISAAIVRLASHYRKSGALVVFEPSGAGDPRLFHEAVACAHVVKYSRQRLEESDVVADDSKPKLLVETWGEEGLRFRTLLPHVKTKRWRSMPAIPAAVLRDTAGCGDWCTAGIISRLAIEGARTLLDADEEQIADAVRYGQALAAWNCAFEGARGGMYESTRRAFEDSIASLLAGNPERAAGKNLKEVEQRPPESFACVACPPGPAKAPRGNERRRGSRAEDTPNG
jgi:sugar/nucleoside kinase (ribokinase family)